jgi:uncharacterized protein (TIGR00369 family)
MTDFSTMTGVELMTEFLKYSPFALHVGLRPVVLEPDRVSMALEFREALVTVGDVVHGGAISTLIDVAATAAAWSGAVVTGTPQGATVALAVSFLRAAHGQDLLAEARVLRRGSSLCFCEVGVSDTSGALVALGLVTYKIN